MLAHSCGQGRIVGGAARGHLRDSVGGICIQQSLRSLEHFELKSRLSVGRCLGHPVSNFKQVLEMPTEAVFAATIDPQTLRNTPSITHQLRAFLDDNSRAAAPIGSRGCPVLLLKRKAGKSIH